MSEARWVEVRAEFDAAPDDASVFVDAFARFGCPGILEHADPPGLSGYLVEVEGTEAVADALSEELARLGAPRIFRRTVDDEDWSQHWKRFFKPRRVGKHFVIRPTWEPFELGPDDLELVLDPGQAFGTGEHPTTRGCLELMETLDLGNKSVLDLGCGSGVLSIAAVKLGSPHVVGVDIEPLSVEVAKQNAERNGVEIPFLAGDGLSLPETAGPWDVCISNIISATLIRLAPGIAGVVRSGGDWIVSGVLNLNWADVERAALRAGFQLATRREEDDWIAAHFRRL